MAREPLRGLHEGPPGRSFEQYLLAQAAVAVAALAVGAPAASIGSTAITATTIAARSAVLGVLGMRGRPFSGGRDDRVAASFGYEVRPVAEPGQGQRTTETVRLGRTRVRSLCGPSHGAGPAYPARRGPSPRPPLPSP